MTELFFLEGPSDKLVFLQVLQSFNSTPAPPVHRTKIVPLRGDGTLKSKNRIHIIRLLIDSIATEAKLPLLFMLDSNVWTASEQREPINLCVKSGTAKAYFLQKPELESYLLEPAAISHVITNLVAQTDQRREVTVESVQSCIQSNNAVDGADLLSECFRKWNCEYDKNRDAIHPANRCIDLRSALIEELALELSATIFC
jgi:hypothetical protein